MSAPQEPTDPSNLFSPFLPSTYNMPEDEDRIKTYLVDQFTLFSDLINDKKIGSFITETESFNGEKWWYIDPKVTRNGYQTFIYIPSLPNDTTLTITLTSNPSYPIERVDQNFVITNTYGTASKPPTAIGAGNGDYFTFLNQGDSRISWTMSDDEIIITTTTDLSAYSGFIVISYLRRGF